MSLYEKPNMDVLKLYEKNIITASDGLIDDGEGGNDIISGDEVFG